MEQNLTIKGDYLLQTLEKFSFAPAPHKTSRIKVMIHGGSKDPVLIKKINLRIWTLRDEIEAVIKKRLQEETNSNIDDLITEYTRRSEAAPNNVTAINDAAQLDNSEDEMARALAEAEAGDDSSEEQPETAQTEPKEDKVIILQRKPFLDLERVIAAKTILTEIGMDQIFFFCNKKFTEGQSIVIEFLVPKHFILNAEVAYCRTYNMKSRIISECKMPYRAAAKFTFLKTGERTLLRQFIHSIETDIPEPVTEIKKQETQESSDDFSELDDL